MNTKSILRRLAGLLALIISLPVLTACEDDKPFELDPMLSGGTVYTELNGLIVNSGGSPVVGKTVKVVTSKKNPSKATLVIWSNFDTRLIPGISSQLEMVVSAPGVLPGTPRLDLDVTLSQQGEAKVFSGSGKTEFCTYNYNGSISDSGLELNFTDVELIDKALAGVRLTPAPPVVDEADVADPVKSSPFYVEWEPAASTLIDFGDVQLPAGSALRMMLDVVPSVASTAGLLTPAQALYALVESMELQANGDVILTLRDALDPAKTVRTAPNMIQYVLTGSGSFRLFVNPQMAILSPLATRAEVSPLIQALAIVGKEILPMLSEGVPMHFQTSATGVSIYAPSEVLLPLLQEGVLPVVNNRTQLDRLIELAQGNPALSGLNQYLAPVLRSLPGVIKSTKTVNLGLNFIPAV